MKYRIDQKQRIFDEFFHIDRVELEIERFNGDSLAIRRYHIERPDVVGVILEKPSSQSVVMVEQFRYSTIKHNPKGGWLTEIVGGIVDAGEKPLDAAKRECLEETGYNPPVLEHLTSYFASSGFSNELIHLYHGQVDEKDRIEQGGGVEAEKEDLRVFEMDFEEALDKIINREITDAKTILALQWLALKKRGLKG